MHAQIYYNIPIAYLTERSMPQIMFVTTDVKTQSVEKDWSRNSTAELPKTK